jgi:hypothetical protein
MLKSMGDWKKNEHYGPFSETQWFYLQETPDISVWFGLRKLRSGSGEIYFGLDSELITTIAHDILHTIYFEKTSLPDFYMSLLFDPCALQFHAPAALDSEGKTVWTTKPSEAELIQSIPALKLTYLNSVRTNRDVLAFALRNDGVMRWSRLASFLSRFLYVIISAKLEGDSVADSIKKICLVEKDLYQALALCGALKWSGVSPEKFVELAVEMVEGLEI